VNVTARSGSSCAISPLTSPGSTSLASPTTAGTGRTLLVVDDPDAMFVQTAEAGATAASEMADVHGWRLGRILDPFGHEREIGRPLGQWPPA
jgi:uncharacterized glyoxalase superfamily protein PhnB